MPYRLEVRGLEQDIGRRLPDLRLEAAHDPGDRDRAQRVADQQVAQLEPPFDAVERHDLLALLGAADDDPSPGQALRVERVQRAAEREHHVVRHVHDV